MFTFGVVLSKEGSLDMVKWGILGGAVIAKDKVVPAIRQQQGEIYAVASRSGDEEKLWADFQMEKLYRSYEALIEDPEVDIVYIALPNQAHFEWAKKALQQGKHVLSEKPLTVHKEEAKILLALAKKENRQVIEGFMYQYHPQIAALKQHIDKKTIGDLKIIQNSFHFMMEDEAHDIRMQAHLDGGAMNDLGCYLVHSQHSFVKSDFKDIQVLADMKQDVDVRTAVQVRYENGVIGQMNCSFYGTFTNEMTLIGTEGKIHVPNAYRTDVMEHKGILHIEKDGLPQIDERYVGDAYQLQIAAVHEKITTSVEPSERIVVQASKLQQIQRKLREVL